MTAGATLFAILAVIVILAVVVVLKRRANQRAAAAKANLASATAASSRPLRSAITTTDPQTGHTADATGEPASENKATHVAPGEAAQESEVEHVEEEHKSDAAELIAEGDEHMQAFAYDDAIESYEGAVDAVSEEHGRESLEFADLLVKTEDAYMARDNGNDDDDLNCNHYLRALSIMERCIGLFDARLLPVINRIVAFYFLVGKVSEAEGLMRRQQLIELRVKQAQQPAVQPVASVVASVVVPVNGPASAPALGVEPIPASTEHREPAPTIVATVADAKEHAHTALETGDSGVDKSAADGDAARLEFDYDGAADHYTEALDAARESFGRDSVKLVPILVRLGEVCHVRDILDSDDDGDTYSDPLDRTSLALSLLVREAGTKDARLLPVLTNMAAFNDQIGEHYKADRYLAMIDSINEASRQAALSRR